MTELELKSMVNSSQEIRYIDQIITFIEYRDIRAFLILHSWIGKNIDELMLKENETKTFMTFISNGGRIFRGLKFFGKSQKTSQLNPRLDQESFLGGKSLGLYLKWHLN